MVIAVASVNARVSAKKPLRAKDPPTPEPSPFTSVPDVAVTRGMSCALRRTLGAVTVGTSRMYASTVCSIEFSATSAESPKPNSEPFTVVLPPVGRRAELVCAPARASVQISSADSASARTLSPAEMEPTTPPVPVGPRAWVASPMNARVWLPTISSSPPMPATSSAAKSFASFKKSANSRGGGRWLRQERLPCFRGEDRAVGEAGP